MTPETWTAVDAYIQDKLVPEDPVLAAALKASDAGGLPAIQVSPAQGKLLQILARLVQARSILEVGTLAGYSTIWLARALPAGGRIVTLELEPKHAAVAQSNLARAGLTEWVDLRVGRATTSLRALVEEGAGPFDLVFIDADKPGTTNYFHEALRLSRPGTLIVVDNVIRKGGIVDPASEDASVQGMRRFFDALAAEPRVSATAIQTVGVKGYDGFAIATVLG